MRKNLTKRVFFLFVLLILAVLLGLVCGSANIPVNKLFEKENQPILYLRIFRILMGMAAGSGLGVCGIVLQAILRNSLAEPYLLGASSGAGFGAIIAIIIGISGIYLPLTAFLGAILSIILVYSIAKENNRILDQSLILSGVIVSVALSAIIVFLVSISGNEAMHSLTWWLWGSLQVLDFKLFLIVSVIVFFGILIIYLFSQDLNAISIGEEDALHLGINSEQVKKVLILVTSLITASLVCMCGIIGFVGLIIPHIMRIVVGSNHRILIPSTCLAASIFMILSDTLSRTMFPPFEIPIGVITALLGAPTFIFLLKK
ncbi:iron ABC transporter permease, partial [bacterium]